MAGAQSEVTTLRRVVLRHARDAFRDAAAIDRQWQDLNYLARPDFTRAVAEYDGFVELLRDSGAVVHCLPADGTVGLDSIYVRDASIVCDRGVILCSMGKPQRAAEPAAQDAALRALGIPIHGAIAPPGRVEGGKRLVFFGEPRVQLVVLAGVLGELGLNRVEIAIAR